MDVNSRIPVKLATGETLEGLDSLRLVALSSGIGLDVDNRSPKVLVMNFSGMSSQGKMRTSSSLASRELPYQTEIQKPKVIASNSTPKINYENTPKINQPINQPVNEPQSDFRALIEENNNTKLTRRLKNFFKGMETSIFKRKSLSSNPGNLIKKELKLQTEPKKFTTRVFIKIKQIIAHSIDICIVFNFSLLVICLLSMIFWGIYPSDIISSPIVGYILQMRWIEFMFWIYVAFFIYRYLLRHLIGATLGSKLCFGRITKTKASKA